MTAVDAHVEQDLLAYLDDELPPRRRAEVEAHLRVCAACRAELEQLGALQAGLGSTFDAALTSVRLPLVADERIRRALMERATPRQFRWRLWQARGLVGQVALFLLVMLCGIITFRLVAGPGSSGAIETIVLGQDRLAPGSPAGLRVIVRRSANAAPVPDATVSVRVGRTPGMARTVYEGRTEPNGTLDVSFRLPETLEGDASLVVETYIPQEGGHLTQRVVRPIVVSRSYKLFLYTDRPIYRRADTVHARLIALDAADLSPAEDAIVEIDWLTADGQTLKSDRVRTSEFGVATSDITLPETVAAAPHAVTVRARLGDTVSERTLAVTTREDPAFRVELEPARSYYLTDERVRGTVKAVTFFGKPIAGGQVRLRGVIQGEPLSTVEITGETDAQGIYRFAFALPASLISNSSQEAHLLRLEAEVFDAIGRREGTGYLLPIAGQRVLIRAIPESGELKPGVENTIYILTSYPDGTPARTTVTAILLGETLTGSTGPHGTMVLHVNVDRETRADDQVHLTVRATDAEGEMGEAAIALNTASLSDTLLLRTDRAIYRVGETLKLEALVIGEGTDNRATVYLDILQAGQTVATLAAPIEDGRARFALDLDASMVGTLEAHAYRLETAGTLIDDARLFVVEPGQHLAVDLAADRQTYRPGETAHVTIETSLREENQTQPVQAVLGIGVVDEAVYALDRLPVGFGRAFVLLDEYRETGIDGAELSAHTSALVEAQDLAARAAWADASAEAFSLATKVVNEPPRLAKQRAMLSLGLALCVTALSLLITLVVARSLKGSSVLRQAFLRWMLIATIGSVLATPLACGLLWLRLLPQGPVLPLTLLGAVILILGVLAVRGWRRRELRLQFLSGLLGAYLILVALLLVTAAQGGSLPPLLIAITVAALLVTICAVGTFAQGLVLEGWRRVGWATTLLSLLLALVALCIPLLPGIDSPLAQTLSDPHVLSGPIHWMVGCAPKPMETGAPQELAPETAQEPAIESDATDSAAEVDVEATVEVEGGSQGRITDVIPLMETAPTSAEAEQESRDGPTNTPSPTTTPVPFAETYPLRQVFPETLYWNPDALTDEQGRRTLDIPLADTITTWRLTALATTREGHMGSADLDVVVFQDVFAEIDVPTHQSTGDPVTATVTVYNYSTETQQVRLQPEPADWYRSLNSARELIIEPNDLSTATLALEPERPGQFTLEVAVSSEKTLDIISVPVLVAPATP